MMTFWSVNIFLAILALRVGSQYAELRFIKETFDPSSFTADVLQCHSRCADEYYECAAFQCAMIAQDMATDINNDIMETAVETKRSFWSRFLYYFSFGLLDSNSKTHKDENNLRSSFVKDANVDTSIDKQYICEENCTRVFRDCYFNCVCRALPRAQECQPIVVIPKILFPPTMAYRVVENGPYVFDWNNV